MLVGWRRVGESGLQDGENESGLAELIQQRGPYDQQNQTERVKVMRSVEMVWGGDGHASSVRLLCF